MRILISGASGMLGSALVPALRNTGHSVNRLVRPGGSAAPGDVGWNPETGRLENGGVEGVDAIVHLAGANIGAGRWTAARKQLLRSSRVDATRGLVTALGTVKRAPKVFIAASAIGIYGDRGEEELHEQSPPGSDFLSLLAREWEAESLRAAQLGMRVVLLRFGVILSPAGGALARMLLPFKLGAGGKLGSGQQWMSWLTLAEAVAIVSAALKDERFSGPINAVAPQPARNVNFTRLLARALKRPAFLPAPGFALRLALGEMADALLLSSQRVVPRRLQELGYPFAHPQLEAALEALLGK